jgi:hypothetical protein
MAASLAVRSEAALADGGTIPFGRNGNVLSCRDMLRQYPIGVLLDRLRSGAESAA